MQTHKFYKENSGGWYIDLPQYLEAGGSKGDLAMVAGADTMLDIVAEGRTVVTITTDTEPFEGADKVQLLKLCEPSMGGGYYLMSVFEGRGVHQEMWLWGVTEFVFGRMPVEIYLKRVPDDSP